MLEDILRQQTGVQPLPQEEPQNQLGLEGSEEVNPPNKTINFDVERNPQDMQLMTDVAMYAPMLKQMDRKQRKQKWPEIASKLGQVSPKLKNVLDPSLPPTDTDLDSIVGKIPESTAPKKEKAFSAEDLSKMSDDEFLVQGTLNAPEGEDVVSLYGDPAEERRIKRQEKLRDHYRKEGKEITFDKNGKIKSISKSLDPDKKEKPTSSDAAGKIMMMEVGKVHLATIKKLLFNKNGSINRENLGRSHLPHIAHPIELNKPGGRLANAFEHNIQALTRSETGAAMPAAEVDNTRKRYQPKFTDSDEVIIQKYLALKLAINGYLDVVYVGKDGKNHFDDTKARAYEAKTQAYVQNYREDWVKRALADPKNQARGITPELAMKAFNKKLLFDRDFLDKIGKEVRKTNQE